MERNMTTISLEITPDIKKAIQQAVQDLCFHNQSELVRTGIRKVLDEIKMKKQVERQTDAQV